MKWFMATAALAIGLLMVSSSFAAPPPAGRPNLIPPYQEPAGTDVRVTCGYGCFGHRDSHHYAVDFQRVGRGEFPVIAAAGGNISINTSTKIHLGGSVQAGCPVDSDPRDAEIQGISATIDHGNGWKTFYLHLKDVRFTSGYVRQGEVIGTAGCTGANSVHLHFTLFNGRESYPVPDALVDPPAPPPPPPTPPPTVSVSVSPDANSLGWNRQAVTVNWTVTPSNAGRSGDCASRSNPETIGSETSGLTRTCTASNGGGSATATTRPIKIDMTPPLIQAIANPPPNAKGWNNTDVSVHFDCRDVGPVQSGIVSCTSDQVVVGEGQRSVTGTTVDKADNSATATLAVRIDRKQPSSRIVLPSRDPRMRDFRQFSSDLGYEANDPPGVEGAQPSGVAYVELWYRYGPAQKRNGVWKQYDGQFATSPIRFMPPQGTGFYDLYTIAVDNAGNREEAPSVPDARYFCVVRFGTSTCVAAQGVNVLGTGFVPGVGLPEIIPGSPFGR